LDKIQIKKVAAIKIELNINQELKTELNNKKHMAVR
jgi:hypothetical protein